MRRTITIVLLALLLCASAACQKLPVDTAADMMNTLELIEAAKYTAEKGQRVRGRKSNSHKRELALEGQAYANRCIELSPQTAECYYWRAVNTGLYHQVKIRGYQQGVQQMIRDCEKVIALGKGDYDHAGPYRIPGQIYTMLPLTTGRPDSITRDLDKAEDLLQKAVELAPDYPENHLAFAELLYRLDEYNEALSQVRLAKEQAPEWRLDASYNDWQNAIVKLMRKIEKKQ